MPVYMPDTNVLIDFGRVVETRGKIQKARADGADFKLAPPALIELVRGLVTSDHRHFSNDKQVFEWMVAQKFDVLPLPRPFMANILKSKNNRPAEVEPEHYMQLIQMVSQSNTFEDFIKSSKTADSSWKQIDEADEIHNGILDQEFAGLEKIATGGRALDLARQLSRSFGAPGNHPIPLILAVRFSAALEFLKASLSKVGQGAKPRKNDPGLYVDFQLLLYLADPGITFLTKENFSNEIRASRQKDRIVHPQSLASGT